MAAYGIECHLESNLLIWLRFSVSRCVFHFSLCSFELFWLPDWFFICLPLLLPDLLHRIVTIDNNDVIHMNIKPPNHTSSWKHSKINYPCSFSYSLILSSVFSSFSSIVSLFSNSLSFGWNMCAHKSNTVLLSI